MRYLIFCLILSVFSMIGIVTDANDQVVLEDRSVIFNALLKHGVLDKNRQLVHLSQTCSLQIGSSVFPVVDIRELVKGAMVPRGINHIIVLNSSLVPVQKIEYTTQRPLYCINNQLFLFGDLMIDGCLPEGNVLTFSNHGRKAIITHMEANDFPAQANCY